MKALVAAIAMLGVAGTASADPLDEFGFGSGAAGVAGARTATSRGPEAAYHNPAGVAIGDYPAAMVGWGFGAMWDPLESTCRHASLSIL